MAIGLTLLLLLALCGLVAVKVFRVGRRAAAVEKGRAAALLAREEATRACLRRAAEAKEKNAVAAVARAVGKDPERAARVLGGMMRRETPRKN